MPSRKNAFKIISVGGSIIIPQSGFDISFLKKFRALILRRVAAGERFILVIGGGATCRQYQQAARALGPISNTDLDWLGIQTIMVNAQLVRFLFGQHAHPEILNTPLVKHRLTAPITVFGGWKPGASSDNVAVLLAKTYGATEILNLSNIEYVYDRDPKLYPDAQPIEAIDWVSFRKNIVGDVWEPGNNAPFDPVASRRAQQFGLQVAIIKGTSLVDVGKALTGKKFRGTKIHP